MSTKADKFKQIVQTLNDSLSREDFLKAFRLILQIILNTEKKQDLKIKESLEFFKKELDELLSKSDSKLGGLKERTDKEINRLIDKVENALTDQAKSLNFIRDKVRKIKKGIDGKDGKDGIDGKNGTDGKDGSPDKPKEIRDKLESLEDEDRLDISAIKGWEKIGKATIQTGFNYGAIDMHLIDDETPAGTPNGILTDFVLAHIPSPATSLKVYLDGQRMSLTTDYTLSGQTITFLVAPLTNSIIKVEYRI